VRAAPRVPESAVSVAPAPVLPVSAPVSAPALPAAVEPDAGKAPAIALAELDSARWIDLFHQLPLTGVARNIAANSVLQEVNGNRLALLLEEGKATLYNDEHRKRIEAVLADYFTVPLQLRVEVGAVNAETPAAWRARREAERKEAARRAFVEDELVRAVVERFGAEIQYDSITASNPDNLH
jgi:DNA polymerase-3 subunit gamma/tau